MHAHARAGFGGLEKHRHNNCCKDSPFGQSFYLGTVETVENYRQVTVFTFSNCCCSKKPSWSRSIGVASHKSAAASKDRLDTGFSPACGNSSVCFFTEGPNQSGSSQTVSQAKTYSIHHPTASRWPPLTVLKWPFFYYQASHQF